MSLPIVIIFERHWDEIPKLLVKSLLPSLVAEGYNTLCIEAPQELSSEELRSSSVHFIEVTSRILSEAEMFLRRARIETDCKLSDMSYGKLSELMRLYVSSKKYFEVAEKIKHLPVALLLKDIFGDVNSNCS